jgi:hypothetical protein
MELTQVLVHDPETADNRPAPGRVAIANGAHTVTIIIVSHDGAMS